MATRNVNKIALKDKLGNLNVLDLSKYALVTNLETVKAAVDLNTADLQTIKTSIRGGDLANFAKVAFKDEENEFTVAQKITVDGKTISVGPELIQGEATSEADVLKFGVNNAGTISEVAINANGSITRSAMPTPTEGNPLADNEIATVKYVKDTADSINSGISEFLHDATDTVKGVVTLSDEPSDLDAATGKTAVTPKALKTVKAVVDTNATDIAKLKEDLGNLENTVNASNAGQKTLAFKDYTVAANQTDMESGVYYMVPFNKEDQYIAFDPNTGRPSATQAEGVTDKTVKYCVILYKTSDGTVANLGLQDQEMDFDQFSTLVGNNEFRGKNTFTVAPVKTAQSAVSDLSDIEDGTLISKKELTDYVGKVQGESSIRVTESDPTLDEMQEGALYLVVDATSAV